MNRWIGKIFKRSVSSDIERAVSNALIDDKISASSVHLYVGEEGSLAISAVWACVRLLSNSIGTLPVHLYSNSATGKVITKNHPAYRVLLKPSDYLTKSDLLKHLMIGVTLWGNGYARIYRDAKMRPRRIKLLAPYDVSPVLSLDDESLFYRVNSTGEMLPNYDVLHLKGLSVDGVVGKSPIAVHRENLALTIAAQEYGKLFFTQGGNASGVFEHPTELKDEAYNRLKKDLIEKAVGLASAHTPLLLEGGMKYNRITIPLEDAQFINTRKLQKNEMATIFGVPPHKIADLERATNNNIEHQSIEFVSDSILPYVVSLEEQLNEKLLREDEAGDYYFKFALEGLLRGDSKSRGEFYNKMNLVGAMNANEIREKEDMNPYKGGETYFVQQNMQTIEKAINNDGE